MELAHADYVEMWEGSMNERLRNPQGNRGSDILLMFKLKAERPEKYREEVKVLNTEAPIRMLEMLKELGKRELEQTVEGEYKELPAPAEEGEYRGVSVPRQEAEVKTPPPPEGVGMSPPRTEVP